MLSDRGQQLIAELKQHIIDTLREQYDNNRGCMTVEELQLASGLTIQGLGGGEVWFMAVVTLLVDLLKAGRISAEAGLNTKEWRSGTRICLIG